MKHFNEFPLFKSIGAARFRRADTAPDVAHVALSHPVAAPVPESVPARARPLSEVAEHPAAPAPLCGTAIDLSQDDAALNRVTELGYRQAPVVVAGADHWSGFRPDMIARLAS